jgi:hypothetical protein
VIEGGFQIYRTLPYIGYIRMVTVSMKKCKYGWGFGVNNIMSAEI